MFSGRGGGGDKNAPSLAMGRSSNVPQGTAGHAPPSGPSPAVINGTSTVTEFYGPAGPRSSQPVLVSAAKNGRKTPQAPQASVWTLGKPSEKSPTTSPRSYTRPTFPLPTSPPQPNLEDLAVTDLSHLDPSRATPLTALSGRQAFIDCPHCKRRTLTRLEEENGKATMQRSVQMLFFFGFGALLPLFYKWDQDLVYYCMTCKKKLAIQKYSIKERRLQKVEVLWSEGKKGKGEKDTELQTSEAKREAAASTPASPGPKELSAGADASTPLSPGPKELSAEADGDMNNMKIKELSAGVDDDINSMKIRELSAGVDGDMNKMKIKELSAGSDGDMNNVKIKELSAGADGDRNNMRTASSPAIVVAELEGKPMVDAEMAGTEAAKELEVKNQVPVFEMEHLNRGAGTQKRIRRTLGLGRKEQPPMPPLPR